MDQISFDLTEVHANADWWWKDCAWRALQTLAATGRPFTANDLTDLGVPDPDHPARWGALFRVAMTAGIIRPVGYRPSTRRSRHGGILRVWVGVREPEEQAA